MNRKQKGLKRPQNGKKIKRLKLYLGLYLTAITILASPLTEAHAPYKESLTAPENHIDPKTYARYIAESQYNWQGEEWKCLGRLWGKESAWNYKAVSPTLDYGIPQRHMKNNNWSEISDFIDNPKVQIDWGLNYIQTRYGSPCQAWQFHKERNWY